jgi:hypothetical protein
MPRGAVKCTKCDSYQNWFRGISLSATILALLTALVSVAGSTLPNLFSWIKSGDSRLAVSFAYDDDQGGFFLTATNDGDRVGSIAKVTLTLPLLDKEHVFVATLDPAYNPTVEPSKSQKIRYTLDVGRELANNSTKDVRGACVLAVGVREFLSDRTQVLKQDCKDLRPLDFGRKAE